MKLNAYKVIGLMSGTSLDGIDLAYCYFYHKDGNWKFELIKSKNIGYTKTWKQKLQSAIHITAEQLLELDIIYGKFLGTQVHNFIKTNMLDVDFIATHGHTIFHQPNKGFTLQIGSGQEISIVTKKKVISNFRVKDVAFGGQGAPLVPIGDQALFSKYKACLNLGGVANISFDADNKRIAFDIGLANMLLNYLANQLGKPYDASGLIARGGTVNNTLLTQLNSLDYFNRPYPKSLGYEWFLSDMLPIIKMSNCSMEDKLCTAVEHEAIQISNVLKKNIQGKGEILVTGGGAFNTFLIERIKNNTPKRLITILPNAKIINYKEAIIFAFMGILRNREEVNCLKSVTGASINVSGGEIFLPY